jgi:hypothetical protein
VNEGAALAAGFTPNRLLVVLAGSVVCCTAPNNEGAVAGAVAVDEAGFDMVPAGDVRENPGAEGVEEGVAAPPMAPKRGFEAIELTGLGALNKLGAAAGAVAAGVVDCNVCVLLGVCPMLPNRPPEAGVLVLFWPPNKPDAWVVREPPPNRADDAAGCDEGAGAAGVVDPNSDGFCWVPDVAPKRPVEVAPLDGGVCAGVVDAKLNDGTGLEAAGVVEPLGAADPSIPPDGAVEETVEANRLPDGAADEAPEPNRPVDGAAPVEAVPKGLAAGFALEAGIFSFAFWLKPHPVPVVVVPNMVAGFCWSPAVVPALPNSAPPLADDADVAAPVALAPLNAGAGAGAGADPVPVALPRPNVEPVALPLPNKPLPAADVGLADVGFPNLNPPPVAAPPLAGGCALPKRVPDAGAVLPKGEGDAPELFPAPEVKLNPDMADVDWWWFSNWWVLWRNHGGWNVLCRRVHTFVFVCEVFMPVKSVSRR